MTDAELDAERLALLAEEQALAVEHERLKSTPNDLDGHRAHRERLKAHLNRVQDYRLLLDRRRESQRG